MYEVLATTSLVAVPGLAIVPGGQRGGCAQESRPGAPSGRTANQRRHRPGDRRLCTPRLRQGQGCQRRACHSPDGHARRARHRHARHHPGHPRRADASGGVRRAQWRARRQCRRLHPARVAHRRHGAGDQCRRRHAGTHRWRARSRWRQATGAEERRKAKDTKDKKEKAKPEKPGLDEKALNDAIAYISLAQLRGRNVAWAEKAVREAASISAEEAVKINVADLMAADLPQLLKKLDGRKVKLQSGEVKLDTKNLALKTHEPDWRNKLLAVIADPNIAYILMLLGIYGLFFELWNPGYVLPGVIGGICLLLALYAFQVLPTSYAGLGLILLGIAFMVGEAFMPSFGALGIGGLVAFVVGSIILFDTDVEGFAVAWQLIAAVAAVSAVFFFGVVYLALKSRQREIVSGAEELIGSLGEALENFDGTGRVRVHSEEWQARSASPLKQGQKIRVVSRDGLVLTVEPLP